MCKYIKKLSCVSHPRLESKCVLLKSHVPGVHPAHPSSRKNDSYDAEGYPGNDEKDKQVSSQPKSSSREISPARSQRIRSSPELPENLS